MGLATTITSIADIVELTEVLTREIPLLPIGRTDGASVALEGDERTRQAKQILAAHGFVTFSSCGVDPQWYVLGHAHAATAEESMSVPAYRRAVEALIDLMNQGVLDNTGFLGDEALPPTIAYSDVYMQHPTRIKFRQMIREKRVPHGGNFQLGLYHELHQEDKSRKALVSDCSHNGIGLGAKGYGTMLEEIRTLQARVAVEIVLPHLLEVQEQRNGGTGMYIYVTGREVVPAVAHVLNQREIPHVAMVQPREI